MYCGGRFLGLIDKSFKLRLLHVDILFGYGTDGVRWHSTAAANRRHTSCRWWMDEWMNVEQVGIHGMIIDRMKPKCWEENLFECHCLHHISHMDSWGQTQASVMIKCHSIQWRHVVEQRRSDTGRGVRLASWPSHLISGERIPSTHGMGGLSGLWSQSCFFWRRAHSCPSWKWNPHIIQRVVVSLYWLSETCRNSIVEQSHRITLFDM